ncbi:SMP-30/gluconolactonase/LRE family protein [Pelagibacterium halotolerans]|uniref:Putative calcium binding transcriptional regulatory protein n=1 Tax=Pelagibacterium halotolerans (strain DSM 22347 / JCM 15775 / CGMCC 1.7692 / B2) TaxID=1082931 RepID=G4R6L5_PELHB|nr:SMP-30/gluconolactonase/LRE family protein [Pelagibacterium halotolerans]AEQ51211.1 putative calcium binding transcriptional regulatory protein [Pelagibacterium halotolerans B2]QJR18926.1 SMP-30/gluconolactonase/LRE family protein [Pelagibacterium halotolerans]SEA68224.1 Sugar lactone lactonase YvrE [Pelagibacterium halotolerans]
MEFEQISFEPSRLGECPLWCERTERLWWVDILQGRLWSYDPDSGQRHCHPVKARRLGSIALCEDGNLVLACDDGLYLYDPETGKQDFFVDPEPGRPENRKNDGRADPYGNFWVGTLREADYAPRGKLYRISPEGAVFTEIDGLSIPNGLAFDQSRARMYFADTRAHAIWRCDHAASGKISNRQIFATTTPPARPDGSCIDAQGNLWNAVYAGSRICQYAPDGEILQSIELPVSHPTCLAFGGPGLDRLFITSALEPVPPGQREREPLAGHVLAFDAGVKGRVEHRLNFAAASSTATSPITGERSPRTLR